MTIAIIVAAAGEKRVIGKDGDLPWHFSSDLRFFKDKTFGHDVLMGRKTYQSILNRLGKPLPGRRNIVLTRDKNFHDDRVTIIHDVFEIPKLVDQDKTMFIIGGAEVYRQVLDIADLIYMTKIEHNIDGDAFFPEIDPQVWKLSKSETLSEKNILLHFLTYRNLNHDAMVDAHD